MTVLGWALVLGMGAADGGQLAPTGTAPQAPPAKSAPDPRRIGGYQGVQWGANPEDVVAAFPGSKNWKTSVSFSGVVSGEEASTDFEFAALRLARVNIRFPKAKGLAPSYGLYDRIKAALSEKYGKPYSTKETLPPSETSLTQAFADQNLLFQAVWSGADGFITLTLNALNRESPVFLVYESRALYADMKKEDEAAQKALKAADGQGL